MYTISGTSKLAEIGVSLQYPFLCVLFSSVSKHPVGDGLSCRLGQCMYIYEHFINYEPWLAMEALLL